jgi:hypothetical protein
VLVVGVAAAHLAKGLDVEEAGVSLVLLAGLLRYRRRFDVPGDPSSLRPLAATCSALAGAGGAALLVDSRGWLLPERVEEMSCWSTILDCSLNAWSNCAPCRFRDRASSSRISALRLSYSDFKMMSLLTHATISSSVFVCAATVPL